MEKYEIIKKIGEGSHSEVFLIKHIKNNKLFILKEVDFFLKDKIDKIRHYREISILKKINHSNIIKYIESFIKKKRILCIIFEYVKNNDLKYFIKNIKNKEFIDKDLLIKWIYQLTKIMFFLKENNIIHRDIKPENILIDENYDLKLCDFGVSLKNKKEEWDIEKEYLGNTKYLLIGSHNYMSLELFSGIKQSFLSDIWSFGCVIFELVYLEKLNNSNSISSLIENLKNFNNNEILNNGIYPNFIYNFLKKILIVDYENRLNIEKIINWDEFNDIYYYYKNIIKSNINKNN